MPCLTAGVSVIPLFSGSPSMTSLQKTPRLHVTSANKNREARRELFRDIVLTSSQRLKLLLASIIYSFP